MNLMNTPNAPVDVLIVDDDPKAASILRIYLDHAGLSTALEYSGEAALRHIRKTPPRVLVLDLLMPQITGFDVVEALGADPRGSGIPIVVVSSLPLAPGDIATLGRQVREVLLKTEFRYEQLIALVKRLLAGD